MSKWIKQGDFTQALTTTGLVEKEVQYTNTADGSILRITYTLRHSFIITIEHSRQVYQHLDTAGIKVKYLPPHTGQYYTFPFLDDYVYVIADRSDKLVIVEFLELIDSYHPFDEIGYEVYNYLEVADISAKHKLLPLLQQGKFSDAIIVAENAIAAGVPKIILFLQEQLKLCKNTLDLEPLELKLRFFLLCEEEFQNECNRIYNQLFENPANSLFAANIKGDGNTLIFLAQKMRKMRADIRKLELENFELKKYGAAKPDSDQTISDGKQEMEETPSNGTIRSATKWIKVDNGTYHNNGTYLRMYLMEGNMVNISVEPAPALYQHCLRIGKYTSPVFADRAYLIGQFVNKYPILGFMELINHYYPFDEVKKEIYGQLGILAPAKSERDCRAEILELFTKGKFVEAFMVAKNALAEGYFDIIKFVTDQADLVKNMLTTEAIDEMLNLYISLPRENPHYIKANQFIYDFLNRFHPVGPDNLEEQIQLLEIKLRFVLRCGDPYQADCNMLYNELCGNRGEIQTEKPIKGDADTLILLASKFREVKLQTKNLQQQNAALKKDKAEKKAVSSSESTATLFAKRKLEDDNDPEQHERRSLEK